MRFRYYRSVISQASRNFAKGLFIAGLLLIGLGFLVYILGDLFVIFASILFFTVGLFFIVIAIKVILGQRKLDKMSPDDGRTAHRRNVRIHTEEYYDL